MICAVIYFICFDILILLTFLIFCFSGFFDYCKSPVDIISETNLSVYTNKVSSQYSPDRKSHSFRIFEFTPETTFVEAQEGNSRKIELGDLSWVSG